MTLTGGEIGNQWGRTFVDSINYQKVLKQPFCVAIRSVVPSSSGQCSEISGTVAGDTAATCCIAAAIICAFVAADVGASGRPGSAAIAFRGPWREADSVAELLSLASSSAVAPFAS